MLILAGIGWTVLLLASLYLSYIAILAFRLGYYAGWVPSFSALAIGAQALVAWAFCIKLAPFTIVFM